NSLTREDLFLVPLRPGNLGNWLHRSPSDPEAGAACRHSVNHLLVQTPFAMNLFPFCKPYCRELHCCAEFFDKRDAVYFVQGRNTAKNLLQGRVSQTL